MGDHCHVTSDGHHNEPVLVDNVNAVTVEPECIQHDRPSVMNGHDSMETIAAPEVAPDQLSPGWLGFWAVDDSGGFTPFDSLSEGGQMNHLAAGLSSLSDTENDYSPRNLQLACQNQLERNELHHEMETYPRLTEFNSAMSPLHLAEKAPTDLGRRHTCKDCQRHFANEYLLEDHARRERHRSYVCLEPGCSKSYCRRDVLRRHVATHIYSAVSCPVCSRSNRERIFKRKDNLNQHVRTRHPEFYERYKSVVASSPHHRNPMAVPDFSDTISYPASEDNSEYSHCSSHGLSPQGSDSGITVTGACPSTIVRDIGSALRSILRDENHIALQIIEQQLDFCSQSVAEKLALSLAYLVLVEPNKLPKEAKEQLQHTSAKRAK